MKRAMLIGKTGCGKTSFCQAIHMEPLEYLKTQCVEFSEDIIDLPGEYLENRMFYKALMVTSCEADMILFFQDATDDSNFFPEAFSSMFTLPVYGIITKIDAAAVQSVENARQILKLAGCRDIFEVSNTTGEGIALFKARIADCEEPGNERKGNMR